MHSLPALRNELPAKSTAIQKQPDTGCLFEQLPQGRIRAVPIKTALGFITLFGRLAILRCIVSNSLVYTKVKERGFCLSLLLSRGADPNRSECSAGKRRIRLAERTRQAEILQINISETKLELFGINLTVE